MRSYRKARNRNLGFDRLEGKALMSVAGAKPLHQPVAAVFARPHGPKITDASPGQTAFLNAIFGGAGHEFVALAQKEVKNLIGVIAGFESGAIRQYNIPGLAIKSPPNLQSGYTGLPHDALALQAAGAVLLKAKKIELAAVVRGPFTTTPFGTSIVFAINRGAGSQVGPAFASRPGITPDALVTVNVGPDGKNNSATITDLTTGSTVPISARISVAGPTVRILLPASSLPSTGFKIQKYKFAVWTESAPNSPIEAVGSFIPEGSMIPIGVETNLNATI
jgi:hypothetical protein